MPAGFIVRKSSRFLEIPVRFLVYGSPQRRRSKLKAHKGGSTKGGSTRGWVDKEMVNERVFYKGTFEKTWANF